MRVLVLSQYYWPENFRINELVTALQARGMEVEILTGKPNYPEGVIYEGYSAWGCVQEMHQGIRIHRVPLSPRGRSVAFLSLNYLSFIFSGIFFGPWLLRGRTFDAIFIFAPSPILQAIPGIWIGWLKKSPVLLWVQDLWPESLSATGHITHPSILKIIEIIVRWIYCKVDLLLVQSKGFLTRVKSLAGRTPVVYYPNSYIEQASVSKNPDLYCPGFDCKFPVMFAGNLGSAQAVHVILEAAELLRNVDDIRIILVGDGSKREWMIRQAVDRGLSNLVFPGRFPVAAMPILMAQAAALLVTLADKEIFRLTIPSKIQAYLAAGRPIIACLDGAGADVLRESEAGLVVPAEDAAALAKAIQSMHDMTDGDREVMGIKGRSYYEKNFSQEKLVTDLIRYFDFIVGRYRERVL